MPTFSTISHVSFSVRDADKTAQWWKEVFALEQVATIEEDTWRAVLLALTPHIAIEFQEHRANGGEEFHPARTGFDHMGIKVDSRGGSIGGRPTSSGRGSCTPRWSRRTTEAGRRTCLPSRIPTASSSRCSTGRTIPDADPKAGPGEDRRPLGTQQPATPRMLPACPPAGLASVYKGHAWMVSFVDGCDAACLPRTAMTILARACCSVRRRTASAVESSASS